MFLFCFVLLMKVPHLLNIWSTASWVWPTIRKLSFTCKNISIDGLTLKHFLVLVQALSLQVEVKYKHPKICGQGVNNKCFNIIYSVCVVFICNLIYLHKNVKHYKNSKEV